MASRSDPASAAENAGLTSSYQCELCSKCYKRPEHLQRHLATHRAEKPYHCRLCGSSYRRSDVFKRHARSCSDKAATGSFMTKRACDSCSKSKRACDSVLPCSNCVKRSTPCTYSPASSRSAAAVGTMDLRQAWPTSWNSLDNDGHGDGGAPAPYFPQDIYEYFDDNLLDYMIDELGLPTKSPSFDMETTSLRFLESFTRDKGFVSSFECGTEEQRRLARSTLQDLPGIGRYSPIWQPAPQALRHSEDNNPRFADDPLSPKSREIVGLIREVVTINPRNSVVSLTWSEVVEDMCLDFFSPSRLRLYLGMYWAIWHPNVNFMHRPTFDIGTAKAGVVASMAIIGACVSSDLSDNESAKTWFNCIEEVVFRDDDFCYDRETDDQPPSFPSNARIQSVQAAYMVCLYQNWEGTDSSKRRIRRFRYSTVVAVIRDIGISHAQHVFPRLPERPAAFSWADFVAREQLIRTLLWVFLLDTAFVIFNNVPPRMAMKEMKMAFASNEASFQADTSASCLHSLVNRAGASEDFIANVVERMCKGSISSAEQPALADIGPLNLFVLTSAIHSMIFQVQQTFGYDTQMMPIRNALDNWSALWRSYQQLYSNAASHNPLGGNILTPDNMWKRLGFVRFCPEYWLLAKLITKYISNRTSAEPGHVGSTLASNGNALDRQNTAFLERYDTDMQQINGLIAEFQKIII